MCRWCYDEAEAAARTEREQVGRQPVFCPGPAELRQRIEALRGALGERPRPDAHGIGDAIPGTMLYVPDPRRSRCRGERESKVVLRRIG